MLATQPFQHPEPTVVTVGPAFALLVPTTYVTEAPSPSHALHPQAHHNPASVGVEIAVLIVVLVIAARIVFIRVTDAAGRLLASVSAANSGSNDSPNFLPTC